MKSGRYRAPPVRRVHIPKGDGSETRPIGIPTFEDKVAQRAVAMVLSEVYEQEFCDFSYGFRPHRSAHQAMQAVRDAAMRWQGGWIVEVDIRQFFDSVDHRHLREILHRRIGDGVLLRLIGKWVNAGVLEGLVLSRPDEGTPQGGVISPLLANIFLHEVFDRWFVEMVRPALRAVAQPMRYADDIVVLFANEQDARRFLAVLPKRFEKYGLTLHPDKTKLVRFERPNPRDSGRDDDGPGSFQLLGFTFHWGRSRRGAWVVRQRTAASRFTRALRRIREWCRWHRHDPLPYQHRALNRKLLGHYAYYGVTGNSGAIGRFLYEVRAAWKRALARRSQRGMDWDMMQALLQRYPLAPPRVVHRYGT
jgi:group II intron reverse transcriptase/maturase